MKKTIQSNAARNAWQNSIDKWKNQIVNDGILAAKGSMAHYNNDITIDSGGENPHTFFPVVFNLPHDSRTYTLRIFRHYSDKPHTDEWNKGQPDHHAGLHLDLEAGSRQWGGIDSMLTIKRHVYTYTPTIESVTLSSPGGYHLIVYIRGGGGRFHLEGNLPSIMTPNVYYSTTTIYKHESGKYETVVTPKKNPPSTLKKVNPTQY